MPIALLAVVLLGTDPQSDLKPILEEWQRRSAALTSVDVRFTREDRNPRWATSEHHTGRVVLSKKGASAIEFSVKDGHTNRLVWDAAGVHQLDSASRQHNIAPREEKLPAVLALPFLWDRSLVELKSEYRVELLGENPDAWLLAFTPVDPSASTAFLELDRKTYLPRRYQLSTGKLRQDYKVTTIQTNTPVTDELTRFPEGWKVYEAKGIIARIISPKK